MFWTKLTKLTKADTPHVNFEMLSGLNKLDLCDLKKKKIMVKVRLSFSKKHFKVAMGGVSFF